MCVKIKNHEVHTKLCLADVVMYKIPRRLEKLYRLS